MAASAEALKQDASRSRFTVANPDQLGMAGTLLQGIQPSPGASLRVLLDRNLRQPMIAANQANLSLQKANVDGSGHAYWVDTESGFTTLEQSDLIQFLLSLDDDQSLRLSHAPSC